LHTIFQASFNDTCIVFWSGFKDLLEFSNDSIINKFLIILKIFKQLFCDGICLFSSDSIDFDGFIVIVDLPNDLENFIGFLWRSGSFECGDDEFLTVEEAVGFL
jgi:hypothetical protein